MRKKIPATALLALVMAIGLITRPSIAVASNESECDTHQTCPADQRCECSIIPSSAYERYFYWDVTGIKNKSHYTCTFNSSPRELIAVMEKSAFPGGSKYQCIDCSHFPTTILLDTSKVKEAESTLIVSYFVPASDIPETLEVLCETTTD